MSMFEKEKIKLSRGETFALPMDYLKTICEANESFWVLGGIIAAVKDRNVPDSLYWKGHCFTLTVTWFGYLNLLMA